MATFERGSPMGFAAIDPNATIIANLSAGVAFNGDTGDPDTGGPGDWPFGA